VRGEELEEELGVLEALNGRCFSERLLPSASRKEALARLGWRSEAMFIWKFMVWMP
jgi:hypothetical protein